MHVLLLSNFASAFPHLAALTPPNLAAYHAFAIYVPLCPASGHTCRINFSSETPFPILRLWNNQCQCVFSNMDRNCQTIPILVLSFLMFTMDIGLPVFLKQFAFIVAFIWRADPRICDRRQNATRAVASLPGTLTPMHQ